MKGARECNYPGQVEKSKDRSPKASQKKQGTKDSQAYRYNSQASDYDSDSTVDFELSQAEDEDGSQNKGIVRFSSASGPSDSPSGSPQFAGLQFNQQMLLDGLGPPLDFEPRSRICEEIRVQAPPRLFSTLSALMVRIPEPPKPARSGPVQFFLDYYQTNVNESYYFDYVTMRKNTLLALSEDYDALRHAVVAFSALIYSMKVNSVATTPALLYYTIALKQLRADLEKMPIVMNDCHAAIATALQLAAFDVISISLAR